MPGLGQAPAPIQRCPTAASGNDCPSTAQRAVLTARDSRSLCLCPRNAYRHEGAVPSRDFFGCLQLLSLNVEQTKRDQGSVLGKELDILRVILQQRDTSKKLTIIPGWSLVSREDFACHPSTVQRGRYQIEKKDVFWRIKHWNLSGIWCSRCSDSLILGSKRYTPP